MCLFYVINSFRFRQRGTHIISSAPSLTSTLERSEYWLNSL